MSGYINYLYQNETLAIKNEKEINLPEKVKTKIISIFDLPNPDKLFPHFKTETKKAEVK